MRFIFALVLGLFFISTWFSCASVTKQSKKHTILDTSQESSIEGTGTSSADIRSMAERMAREINGIEWPSELKTIRRKKIHKSKGLHR